MRRFIILLALLGCTDAQPTAPVNTGTGSLPSSKFTLTASTYEGMPGYFITHWDDDAPAVEPIGVQLLPKVRVAVRIPELGNDAELRQTWLTLRELSKIVPEGLASHLYTQVVCIKASPFRSGYYGNGKGAIHIEDKINGKCDRSTRRTAWPERRHPSGDGTVIPGDFVVALGDGRLHVIPAPEFESEYCFGVCVAVRGHP